MTQQSTCGVQARKKENPRAVPEYKVGVEVKALFKKNHIDLLNPSPEAEALEEKRVMFINKVLKKIISRELHQMTEKRHRVTHLSCGVAVF